MILPDKTHSSLPLFLLMSLGIHIIGMSFFVFLSPKFIEKQSTKITINIGNSTQSAKATTKPEQTTLPSNKPDTPIKETRPASRKTPATPPPIKEIRPAVQQPPVTPEVKEIQPVVKTPPVPKTPTQEIKPVINKPTPANVAKAIPKKEKKEEKKEIVSKPTSEQILASELDNLLKKKTLKKDTVDFLANATWSGTPRKTISFPKLAAHIPQYYKSKGYGFSVTAKITFSPQGWVSSVHLVHTSGDPRIDNIFRTELRKIRIEESTKPSYDTIVKTFTVSVK